MENLDPPNQGWENGAFWLLRDFILDLGGMGVCCSILFRPRLSESTTCVTQNVLYGNHDLKVAVASF